MTEEFQKKQRSGNTLIVPCAFLYSYFFFLYIFYFLVLKEEYKNKSLEECKSKTKPIMVEDEIELNNKWNDTVKNN